MVVYRAGNRTGKSHLGGWEVAARALGLHPFARPAQKILVSALDWEYGVGHIAWPKIKQWLRPGDIRSIAYMRRSEPEIPLTVTTTRGCPIVFRSAEAGRRKYQGVEADFIWLDEEQPEEIISEIRARLVDRGGDFFVTLTPVDRERWVQDLEREPGTRIIRARMSDAAKAGIVDEAAATAFLDALPERERKVRDAGDALPPEGLVYPDYDQRRHVLRVVGDRLRNEDGTWDYPNPLPASWQRYAAMDFGFSNPAAVLLGAVDPNTERLLVYRTLYATQIRDSVWAEILAEWLPPLAAPIVCDHDASGRAELEAVGIPTAPARKDVVPGIEEVARWFHNDRIGIVLEPGNGPRHPMTGRSDAHWLGWELTGYRYPKRRTEDAPDRADLPLKKDDHAADAMRYLVDYVGQVRGGRGAPPPMPEGRRVDRFAGFRVGRR